MPSDDTAVKPGIGIFADNGPRMQREGFAVLPAKGKAPLMAGFPKWKSAPSAAAVNKWAVRNPDADLVYVPGLSRGKRGDPIVVVDGDDGDACSRIVELFGDTPGKVLTRRGRHFLYRDTGQYMGKVQSLKKFGLNADLKHGKSVVVAPPSRHEKDRTFSYAWDACDETVIQELPPFNATALRALIEAADPRLNNSSLCDSDPRLNNSSLCDSKNAEPTLNLSTQCNLTAPAPRPPASSQHDLLHNGSRGLGLNKWLVGKVGAEFVPSLDDLLVRAQAFNSLLVENGHAALRDSGTHRADLGCLDRFPEREDREAWRLPFDRAHGCAGNQGSVRAQKRRRRCCLADASAV